MKILIENTGDCFRILYKFGKTKQNEKKVLTIVSMLFYVASSTPVWTSAEVWTKHGEGLCNSEALQSPRKPQRERTYTGRNENRVRTALCSAACSSVLKVILVLGCFFIIFYSLGCRFVEVPPLAFRNCLKNLKEKFPSKFWKLLKKFKRIFY